MNIYEQQAKNKRLTVVIICLFLSFFFLFLGLGFDYFYGTLAISRQREYLADASSAELTRNPLGLASAIEKIRNAVVPTYAVNNGVAHMCITDPRGSLIEEEPGLMVDLFATHPPMEKRILALKIMAYQKINRRIYDTCD